MGKVGTFRGEWQLTNPQMVLFGADGEASEDLATLSLETIGPLYPLYPATKDVESWDLQKAISFARTRRRRACPSCCPSAVPDEYDVLDARTGARPDPRARDLGRRSRRAQHRYRFEEALVTQLVLGRRRRAVAGHGGQAARRWRRRPARGVRRAAALRAHRAASARSARRSSTTWPSRTR